MKSSFGFKRLVGWFLYMFVLFFGIFLCRLALSKFSFEVPPITCLCMGTAFCLMGLFGFVMERRQIYPIVLDNEKIVLGKRGTFYWCDLEQADLNAKKYGGGNNYRKAIMLQFKEEEPVYLLNYGYGNIDKIRTYIDVVISKQMK